MELPKADDLRALLTVARECAVTRLKVSADGAIEVEMAADTPGELLVGKIDRAAPTEDPLDTIRREVAAGNKMPARDMLDVLVSGARFVPAGGGDPTRPE